MPRAAKLKKDGGGVNSARICVPVCASKTSEMRRATSRAQRLADIIELRLDCLAEEELNRIAPTLDEFIRKSKKPIILTLRSANEGGKSSLTELKRRAFWLKHLAPENHCAAYADIELDSALLFLEWERTGKLKLDWSRIICSHHEFETVARELETIYERMKETPAAVLKIAVRAHDAMDCLPVFQILTRAKSESKVLIPIAMGDGGIPTRVLATSRGAFLTFGSLDESGATAPGQTTAAELRDLYRIENIDEQTEIFGVVGSPVAHSISPHIHNAAFAAAGINAVYLPFETGDIENFIRRMARPETREINWNLRGLSITAPHKSGIIGELDWVEPPVREIGAVNTVVIKDNRLCGYNTDAAAALAPLEDSLKIHEAKIAVIGAGGAARALLWSLRENGANVTVFARNAESAAPVVKQFGARLMPLGDARFGGFDVVVNTTPLGTVGIYENETPATAEQLRSARLAYDLVYNPTETLFLREARAAGCKIIGGLAMLVAQAAEQFRLWTGQEPPIAVMERAARLALGKGARIFGDESGQKK